MKKIIKEVIDNYIKKNCINEINYVAKKSPITVCSIQDFITICTNLDINDSTYIDYVIDGKT